MIGSYVNVHLREPDLVVSWVELRKIDAAGVYVYVRNGIPEGQGMRFFPMARVVEVVDTGRRP
jgi:hypothetical protein